MRAATQGNVGRRRSIAADQDVDRVLAPKFGQTGREEMVSQLARSPTDADAHGLEVSFDLAKLACEHNGSLTETVQAGNQVFGVAFHAATAPEHVTRNADPHP